MLYIGNRFTITQTPAYFDDKMLICQEVSIHSLQLTSYNRRSIVRLSSAKDNFMDTDELDQLESQINDLLLICVELRKENEQLKKTTLEQTRELEALMLERQATEEKVSYLLTRLGPSEPHDE